MESDWLAMEIHKEICLVAKVMGIFVNRYLHHERQFVVNMLSIFFGWQQAGKFLRVLAFMARDVLAEESRWTPRFLEITRPQS